MTLHDIVLKNRSYRRFAEAERISQSTLTTLVDLARQTPSGANKQPLKYALVSSREMCASIYPFLGWAGYLPEWSGPESGERPAAYIVVLGDTELVAAPEDMHIDVGIAAQTIMLGAAEHGLGGCMMGAINRERIRSVLAIPSTLHIHLVLALGRPVEEVKLVSMSNGCVKYWRDDSAVHHVPKRALHDIIVTTDGE